MTCCVRRQYACVAQCLGSHTNTSQFIGLIHWWPYILKMFVLRRTGWHFGRTHLLNNAGQVHACVSEWVCVCAQGKCITELVYLYERAPVLIMPQTFTVHCLVPANFHPEASEQSLHNKVKSSPYLHSRLPTENHYQHSYCYTKGHTDFSSHAQRDTHYSKWVIEINLSHFLVHVGHLLLLSTSEE